MILADRNDQPALDLLALIGQAAAQGAAAIQAPRLPACLTYDEAAHELRIGKTAVAQLVTAGVLDRPEWARTEVRSRVVTTVSVAKAAGWPVVPLEVAVPARDAA